MNTIITKGNPFGANRHGFLWEALRRHPKGKHLDYGAGDGSTLIKLAETGVIEQGIGVDVNTSAIDTAMKNAAGPIAFYAIEKGSTLPFENETFDTASVLDVIEHIYDQKSVLNEINRVLKKEGLLIVTVPQKHIFSFLDTGNLKFVFPRIHKCLYSLTHSKEEYHRRYVQCEHGLFGDVETEKMWHQHFSQKELASLLSDCGFTDMRFDGSGLFTRPIGVISLLMPFIKPLTDKLLKADARRFAHMKLFCTARRK